MIMVRRMMDSPQMIYLVSGSASVGYICRVSILRLHDKNEDCRGWDANVLCIRNAKNFPMGSSLFITVA